MPGNETPGTPSISGGTARAARQLHRGQRAKIDGQFALAGSHPEHEFERGIGVLIEQGVCIRVILPAQIGVGIGFIRTRRWHHHLDPEGGAVIEQAQQRYDQVVGAVPPRRVGVKK